MKNRTDVVSALVSHFEGGKPFTLAEQKEFLLDLAYSSDEKLIDKLVDIVNDIEFPNSQKSQSGEKNGHYWFDLLTNSEKKKFIANFNKERGGDWGGSFELFLDRDYESISKFLRRGFVFMTSNEGLPFWLELETDLRNK